jgi:hypothetical protein
MMEILIVLPSYSRAVAHNVYRGSRTSLLQLYKLSSLSPLTRDSLMIRMRVI